MDFAEYARAFDEVERDFEEAVENWGLPFEAAEGSPRSERLRCAAACGCRCENGGASLVNGWISPACLACRTGEETVTFYVDLRCTRHCYFCFNPNQDCYEHFLRNTRDITAELEEAHAAGARFRCIAITGGEPLLHRDEVLRFLRRAQELYPGVHTRLYTSGDLLDEGLLRELAEAGLTEIRFSVKPPDASGEGPQLAASAAPPEFTSPNSSGTADTAGCCSSPVEGAVVDAGLGEARPGLGGGADNDPVWGTIAAAVEIIPDVMIEVPVIPGTLDWMKGLLVRADSLGVRGVNLLEFCFPLHNAGEFRRRGFRLRKHPYNYLYDYWYGGGIPVAGSETEALALMEFAAAEGLKLGMHYCSSDNKNTGQIYQQNGNPEAAAFVQRECPWMAPDPEDRFLKCAKAFGADAAAVRDWAREAGAVPWDYDESIPCTAIPLAVATAAREALPDALLAESINVVEPDEEGAPHLREVAIRELPAHTA